MTAFSQHSFAYQIALEALATYDLTVVAVVSSEPPLPLPEPEVEPDPEPEPVFDPEPEFDPEPDPESEPPLPLW